MGRSHGVATQALTFTPDIATVARFGGGGNAEAILECLFMGEDQKRLAASQNDAFDPKPTWDPPPHPITS